MVNEHINSTKEKGLDPDTQPNLKSTFKNSDFDCSRAGTQVQENLKGVRDE